MGGYRFLVPAATIQGIRRIHDVGAALTSLHLQIGRVPLCDMATWLNLQPAAQRVVLLVQLPEGWVGVVADSIEDTCIPAELAPLPALLAHAGHDPVITGVGMLDTIPWLIIDLALFARTHLTHQRSAGLLLKE
jgi:chemotaxis signal transduction protein